MAEVNDLINRGIADDCNCEPEHSTMGEEAAARTDIPPLPKAEVSAPPLDTSSQASVEEMETSGESNPINIYFPMAASSNCSDSPTIDLMELQADANLATNHMLSIKRSSDFKRQWVIWGFEASLHQQEANKAVANERAKIVHLRKDLHTKVKCAKAVMRAKYKYRMAIQEARATRCNELQESEAAYLEAFGENTAAKSTQCTILCREHVKHMQELEQQTLDTENKSHQDFLFACQAMSCSTASQRESVCLLSCLIRVITLVTLIYPIRQDIPGRGATICNCFSQTRAQTVPMAKKVAFLTRSTGRHVHR